MSEFFIQLADIVKKISKPSAPYSSVSEKMDVREISQDQYRAISGGPQVQNDPGA